MRIATYEHDGASRAGIVEGDDASGRSDDGTDPISLLTLSPAQRASLPLGDAGRARRDVRLRPPIRPPAVRDFVAFEQHVEGMVMVEGGRTRRSADAWYQAPAFYFSNPNALFGTGDDIEVPPRCRLFDYELEVAAIIGEPGRDLTVGNALEHIAGYTIFNDWSGRDLQGFDRKAGWGGRRARTSRRRSGRGSSPPTSSRSYRDADGRLDLTMTVWRNGEQMGTDSLANTAWSFEQMLVYASRGAMLVPGGRHRLRDLRERVPRGAVGPQWDARAAAAGARRRGDDGGRGDRPHLQPDRRRGRARSSTASRAVAAEPVRLHLAGEDGFEDAARRARVQRPPAPDRRPAAVLEAVQRAGRGRGRPARRRAGLAGRGALGRALLGGVGPARRGAAHRPRRRCARSTWTQRRERRRGVAVDHGRRRALSVPRGARAVLPRRALPDGRPRRLPAAGRPGLERARLGLGRPSTSRRSTS